MTALPGLTAEEKFIAGATESLAARAGLGRDDGENHYRGATMAELARAALHARDMNTDRMSKREVVANALTHTSGDFSRVLQNVSEKAMLKGYDEAEETFQA